MLFSNRDYFFTTEQPDEKINLQAQQFISAGETVTHIFESGDITAFFTDKKIIFANDIKSKFFETELLPYTSISRCNVIGSSDTKYGRLKIGVCDEIILSFLLNEYSDAAELCRMILKNI